MSLISVPYSKMAADVCLPPFTTTRGVTPWRPNHWQPAMICGEPALFSTSALIYTWTGTAPRGGVLKSVTRSFFPPNAVSLGHRYIVTSSIAVPHISGWWALPLDIVWIRDLSRSCFE